jgi:hypothetical protein
LGATAIYGFTEAVARTLRWRWEFFPGFLEMEERPMIFCSWHNRIMLALILYRHYVRLRDRPHRMASLASASRDGGVVARILEHFGVKAVRGSSSRRGPQALLELMGWCRRGYDIAIAPDGPRGPRYVVKSGVIHLAHLTGLPIIPVSYHLGWKVSLRSWDRFQVPLPFSRATVKVGEPVRVPRDASEMELEAFRVELETRLKGITID